MPRKIEVDVTANTGKFKQGMSDAEKATGKLHTALDRFGPVGSAAANILGKLGFSSVNMAAGVVGAAVAVGAAAKVAEDAIRQYISLGDAVRKYSQITGQSAEDSTRQVFAFKELGLDADTLAAGMFKLARAAGNAKDPLGEVGVEVAKNADGTVSLNETLLNVITAWQGTSDAVKQAQIIFAAFGKSGAAMLPILETNAAELRRLEAQVQLTFTAKDLEAIRQYKIAENELKQSNDDLGLSIGRALLPAQTAAIEAMNESIYVNEHLAQSQDYQTAVAHNNRAATMKIAEALRAQYRASLDARDAQTALTASMKQQTEAAQAEAAAEQQLYDSIHKSIDAGFAMKQAEIDLLAAEKAYNAVDGKTQENLLQLKESYVRVADAAVAQAEAQAEANGTTLSAAEKAKIFNDYLGYLISTLDPNSPLRKELQGYIDQLKAIPGNITTKISTAFGGVAGKAGALGVQHFAEGGKVQGPIGSAQPAVVHGGETVLPVGDRRDGGNTVIVHIHGAVLDGPALDRFFNEGLRRARFAPGT